MKTIDDVLAFTFTRLDRLHLPYLVCGSFSSSIFGNRRSTNDVDIVVQISEFDVDGFVSAFEDPFGVSESEVMEALESAEPYAGFQLLEPDVLFKIDVFVAANDELCKAEFDRAVLVQIVPGIQSPVCCPEHVVLRKLLWFDLGGRVSDRQWNDIVGVLEVQKGRLDQGYMDQWADRLGVREMLDEARSQTVD